MVIYTAKNVPILICSADGEDLSGYISVTIGEKIQPVSTLIAQIRHVHRTVQAGAVVQMAQVDSVAYAQKDNDAKSK